MRLYVAYLAVYLLSYAVGFSTGCAATPEERAEHAETFASYARTAKTAGEVIGGPIGAAIAGLGGIAAAAATAYAESQRAKAKRLEAQKTVAEKTTQVLIKGVAKGGDAATKRHIQKLSRDHHVSGVLEDMVAGALNGVEKPPPSVESPKTPQGT